MWGRGTPFHFIGIGGQSMSGLAQGLCQLGCVVSGSDLRQNERTEALQARGARVWYGHAKAAVEDLAPETVVVYTTDVPDDNPELAAARSRGLAVVHRSVVLHWFLEGNLYPGSTDPIAITGTHGKTTTSALIGYLLLRAGLDPTIFVATDLPYLGGSMHLGTGRAVVAEADESDGSLVAYHARWAVITNLEPEHLEHYGNDFSRVVATMERFLDQMRPGGQAVLCADDAVLRQIGHGRPGVLWYGLDPRAALTATDVRLGEVSTFTVCQGGSELGSVGLRIPGQHNVQNALAAIGVALGYGVPFEQVQESLPGYTGSARRFEVLGTFSGITVLSDYAHHPTEIRATLAAARTRYRGRIIAVFQPHRYQRLYRLWDLFLGAFRDADHVIVTDPYGPAGTVRPEGRAVTDLVAGIQAESLVETEYVSDQAEIGRRCMALARNGDAVLFLGAGDIDAVARTWVSHLALP